MEPPERDVPVFNSLIELTPYVKLETLHGGNLYVFNSSLAIEAGFSNEIVGLAKEIVSFQNEVLSGGINFVNPIEKSTFPILSAYLFRYRDNLKSVSAENTSPINPCGDMDYPIPDHRPGTSFYSASAPEQVLLKMGFHKTLGYACGNYVEVDCANDYTSPTWYNGPYGYCEAPIFRMHAATYPSNTSQYSMHGPEPNPELSSYIWPYWSWGVYVKWWHDTF